jgi:glycosyltransferase involved in cell wall biosynthesis
MKILNVAYPFAPVGRDCVGGAEQVLNHIVESIVCAGYESIVIARADSRIPGRLLPIPRPNGAFDDHNTRKRVHELMRETIASTIEGENPDIVHFHGIDFPEYLPASLTKPTLITLHLPPEWYPPSSLAPRQNLHFNCVSDTQATFLNHPVKVIPNGVPIPTFCVPPKKRNFILCLGRICPEKGFHHALDAAAKLDLPLILAGEVFEYEAHQRYFREQIAPRLSDKRRFIGPVGRSRKNRLLAAARCVVIPSAVHETSSLVAMEALACGAPVAAFRVGALPSIIDPGRTGVLADAPSELPDAINSAIALDSKECRRAAIDRFSCEAMTQQYLTLYEDLSGNEFTKRIAPSWTEAIDARTLS